MEASSSSFKTTWGMWLLFVLFAVGTIIMIAQLIKAKRTYQWRETHGTITHTEVIGKIETYRGGRYVVYEPHIEYKYRAMGSEHVSDRITDFSVTSGYRGRRRAQKFLDQYPIGSTVTVYYNPNAPDESVLRQGVRWSDALFVLGYVAATVLVGWLTFAG